MTVCSRCGMSVGPEFAGHLCRNPAPVINGDVRLILTEAIDKMVAAAASAQAVAHATNPKWADVMDVLDECCDDLRAVEATL